jgi:hypothetical protein
MEATPLQPPFPTLLAEYLDPVSPDRVAFGIIQAAGDENIRAQDLGKLLLADPGYSHYLFAQSFLSERMTEWMGDTKEQANRKEILLDRILGLMGKTSIRNLIACARTDRLLGNPVVTEGEEKISVTPSRMIPFALEAEKICEDKNWLFPEVAFRSGLHYDWLSAIIKKRNGPPDEKAVLEAAFKEGLVLAKGAYLLGHKIKDIKLAKFLFSAGLLLPIGKVLMACLFPKSDGDKSWAKFIADCDAALFRKSDFYQFLEARRFSVTHQELSSLFINFAGLVRETEKALYFARNPDDLKRVDPNLYQLSSIISLLERIAMSAEAQLEPHHQTWMKANKVSAEALTEVLKAARGK